MAKLLAFGVSWLAPGGGQVLVGRRLRGLVIGAVVVALLLAARWLPLAIVGLLLVTIAAAVDAAIVAPRGAWRAALHEWLVFLVAFHALRVGYKQWVLEGFKIPSSAMAPTLAVGDHMFVAKLDRTVRRGDVVVFVYPVDRDKAFVHRAVAIAGDRVEQRAGRVYVNGASPEVGEARPCAYDDFDEHTETWHRRTASCIDERAGDRRYTVAYEPHRFVAKDFELVVPPDHFFVLGDNRHNSHDSRFWGPVPLRDVIGKPTYLWWSAGPGTIRWDRVGRWIR